MRDLKVSAMNELAVTLDGEPITIYYRQPTTLEVLAYNRDLYDFDGADKGKPKMNYAVMVDAALKVITGWSDGAFGYDGQPISADPNSPDYREDWRALLKDSETRLLLSIAGQVFSGALVEKKRPFSTN